MNDVEHVVRDMVAQGASVQAVADEVARRLPPAPVKVKLFAHQQEGYERALRCFGYEDEGEGSG